MATLPAKPIVTVDGGFSDWVSSELITTPVNAVPGYSLYGTVQNNTYFIAIQGTAADQVIGAGTTIWLNTDQNTTTGYSPFGSIGADYNITYVNGAFYLYTGAAAQNLVSATPLTSALSADGKSLEIAIPRSLVTPAGGTAPTNINIAGWIDSVAPGTQINFPGDYTSPEYTITDPATLLAKTATHRVAIVYSDTSASLYFNQTAYSDLFMAAQNQARMAGVSYDVIDESQLTNINNLVGYDALIFPSMTDVNTAQLPAIMSTLTSAVYDYHIGIITAGNFLTNDQTGAALTGNPYADMEALLGLQPVSSGTGTVSVTAADVSNPIMQGYTAGQVIQSYTNEGYSAFTGMPGVTPDILVNQNVTGVGTLPGVVETTTGGTNVHFATADLEGDNNLLSHAIQSVVLGTQPGVALHTSRMAGIVAARVDMDQSQFPADVSAAGGVGIYDKLIPILQQWKQTYDFVGSYYINIGDSPNGINGEVSTTNWVKSLPYYKAIRAMGGEIGNHTYTHLINPPTATVTETTTAATAIGSTQIALSALPSFAGVTVGMTVTGSPSIAANTIISAVTGTTVTLSSGLLSALAAGTTLTFGIPSENTNFLQTATTGAVNSATGFPFTYDYEFNQSKLLEQQMLGTTIYGAAVPGASETYATSQNILQYYPSVAPTATTPGYTGYVTGGWTGIGSGYPSAFGYMNPTNTGSVYISPNITFDFTEIEFQHKTVAQAEADWAAQFNSITANAVGTPIVVWPFHDYGAAAWNTTNNSPTGSPYTTQMYTDFIANAAAQNYEFVTLEDLASRIAAQQKAHINYTTIGNAITATITPDPTAPDVGEMSLNVVNGGTQVIQNVTNWYAYNAQELFLPKNGGTFTVNLGAAQDDVTHIASLPMRGDLLSVTGDGWNLKFSMVGEGDVLIDLHGTRTPVITGATVKSQVGDQLTLSLTGTGQHDVSVSMFAQDRDFNGDGRSDILWQNDNGTPAVWLMNATSAPSGAILGGPDPTWHMLGTGDFNGDGKSDILWQNNNGTPAVWLMNGKAPLSSAILGGPDPSWHIVGTGDFNGDGKSDILWQNNNGTPVIWLMNGTSALSSVVLGGPDPTWHIVGTGDFNGDGKSDIVWQNDNGTPAIWLMNGTAPLSSAILGGPDLTWHLVGTGDFNGDGKSDILWQNDNGTPAVWLMNGKAPLSSAILGGPDPTWHSVGTGDVNGDGKSDILWQNDNGAAVVWLMDGTPGAQLNLANPGTAWHISGGARMNFVNGTSGTAPLAGTIQPDEFVLTSYTQGLHTINGFDPLHDIIELSKAQFASFTNVQAAMTPIAGGAMINMGHGSSLLLPGVDPTSLHASNFALA